MHGAVLLDRRGDVVRPALIWCDQRTEPQCLDLEQRVGRERILELTCNAPLTNFTLPKLLWVRENEPDHWKMPQKFDSVRAAITEDEQMTPASVLVDRTGDQTSQSLDAEPSIDEAGFQKYARLARDTKHRLARAHQHFQKRTEPRRVGTGNQLQSYAIGQLHLDRRRAVWLADEGGDWDFDEAAVFRVTPAALALTAPQRQCRRRKVNVTAGTPSRFGWIGDYDAP